MSIQMNWDPIVDPNKEQVVLTVFSFLFFLIPSMTPKIYPLISNMHAIPAVALSVLSLLNVIPEWIPLVFSFHYMFVDGVGMALRLLTDTTIEDGDQTWQFVVHHLGALPMYFHPVTGPAVYYEIKMCSQLLLIELPNPFRYRWETTRKHSDFLMLFPIFFITRILWLAYLVISTYPLGGCGPYIAFTLWLMCLFTWVIPMSKYLDKETHDREYNPPKKSN